MRKPKRNDARDGRDRHPQTTRQLDTCVGLIQITGYGTEPPEVDADYGRVSYAGPRHLVWKASASLALMVLAVLVLVPME